MPIDVNPVWHETYFGDDWLHVVLNYPDMSTEKETDFIERELALKSGMHILDLPCGHGRHSIELASRGLRVTGVDLMPGSVRLATQAAQSQASSFRFQPRFLVDDMRTFVADEPVDAAVVMQSSFGFMATDEQDAEILRNLRRSLVPGGQLLIDVVNPFRLARTMVVPKRWERLNDGTVRIEDREYDFRTGRRNEKLEFFTPDGRRGVLTLSIRIYTLPELIAMLHSTGFEVTGTFGGYDSEPLTFECRRLLVLARRPG